MGSGSTTLSEGQQNMTDEPVSLTNRQLEILALVAEGATDNEIAIRLCLSAKTVSHYVKEIRGRLDAHSRAHAIARPVWQKPCIVGCAHTCRPIAACLTGYCRYCSCSGIITPSNEVSVPVRVHSSEQA